MTIVKRHSVPEKAQPDDKQEVVWIRHKALKTHDLMIPFKDMATIADLRKAAAKEISKLVGEVEVTELRRKNGELLNNMHNVEGTCTKHEVIVAISEEKESYTTIPHVQIEHEKLAHKKVEIWLPVDESMTFDGFKEKVEHMLKSHLGQNHYLKGVKTPSGEYLGSEEDFLQQIKNSDKPGLVLKASTRKEKSCFCF